MVDSEYLRTMLDSEYLRTMVDSEYLRTVVDAKLSYAWCKVFENLLKSMQVI